MTRPPARLLSAARTWIWRVEAEDVGSMMARHAVLQARRLLEAAVERVPSALVLPIYEVIARCDRALDTAFPYVDGLERAIDDLIIGLSRQEAA